MIITVRAGSWARSYLGGETREVQTDSGLTAIEAALLAGIPQDEIGIIAIEKNTAKPDHPLRDGDEILVYPVIIGG